MAKTAKTEQNPLAPRTLSPKALQKALKQSAEQAQRLAAAFGLTVPGIKTKALKH
jgi:uncharacterized protein YggE